MAGATDNPSRRAVLGAAVAIPMIAASVPAQGPLHRVSPGPPPRPGEDWERALAAYRAAEGAVEEAGRVCAAASREEIGAAEDAFGDRLEALYAALRRLLTVPAPDLGALLVKVEAAFEHEIGTLAGCEAGIAAVREDALRLGPSGN